MSLDHHQLWVLAILISYDPNIVDLYTYTDFLSDNVSLQVS